MSVERYKPKKTQVSCGTCQHFVPDKIHYGGIGTCKVGRHVNNYQAQLARGYGKKKLIVRNWDRPLWPGALRICADYLKNSL